MSNTSTRVVSVLLLRAARAQLRVNHGMGEFWQGSRVALVTAAAQFSVHNSDSLNAHVRELADAYKEHPLTDALDYLRSLEQRALTAMELAK